MEDNYSSVDMVYLEFWKAFYKLDNGILLHKLRALGISGYIAIWLYHFLTNRSDCVRLTGGISISFADEIRLYSGVEDITDCDNLHLT